jgi:hypothetical protein
MEKSKNTNEIGIILLILLLVLFLLYQFIKMIYLKIKKILS